MNGLLDEIYVFDSGLSTTEISNLHQFNSLDAPVISEPAGLTSLAFGLLGLGYLRRRRRP
jgi:MYXO-CTERM domain-containing protein